MWIMVAGPYSSGNADAEKRAANLAELNRSALAVFDKGHLPVIGVNMALPMIEAAGQARFDDLMMPISLGLADRCDALLRVGAVSEGADKEVARFADADKPVYRSIDDIHEAIG